MTGRPLLLGFGSFVLDEANARLSKGQHIVPLPPKAFALLCALAGRPGILVGKATLLDVVWPRQDVNEAVLKTTVNQLRGALGDDPRQVRFIETVPRRGYRFVARVTGSRSTENGAGGAHGHAFVMTDRLPGRRLIARDRALQHLETSWQHAQKGAVQLVTVVGEAGMGKTTLIDHFTSRLSDVLIGRGQCVEQIGMSEPYLPVLEALNALCRNWLGLPALLRTIAPAWLAQMPWHMTSDDRLALQAELAGTGPGRMLREFGELLDCIAQTCPLLLVLEDLQWSDRSTLQLLDYIAGRRSSTRQMILISLRPTGSGGNTYPAADLRTKFRLRGSATDLVLAPFSETEVGDYIAQRFPEGTVRRNLVQTLHAHTNGLPLYVATLLDAADQVVTGLARGIDVANDDSALDWLSSQPLQVPESLVHLIDRQIQSMAPADIVLLEAASVVGVEFWAQPVAAMLGRPLHAVRAQVDALTRQGHWLVALTAERLNDGSFDGRSGFRHALYRHAIYHRTGPAVRADLHRRAALALEAAVRLGLPVGPSELAVHHERSLNLPSAVRYGVDAAQLAMTRFAPFEAAQSAETALTLLSNCRELGERQRGELELSLRTLSGSAWGQCLGVAAPEAVAAFERARDLCHVLPSSAAHAWVYCGLGWVHFTRGEYANVLSAAERIEAWSIQYGDAALFICACNLRGPALAYQGHLRSAVQWLQRGLEACDALGDDLSSLPFLIDPVVSMLSNAALPLLQLGEPDAALHYIEKARRRASIVRAPMARMLAEWCAALVGAAAEDEAMVAAAASQLQAIVGEADIAQGEGPAMWYAGWLKGKTRSARGATAIEDIIKGHERHLRWGMKAGCTHVFAYASEAALCTGDLVVAQRELDSGLNAASELDERLNLVDLYLLDARLAIARGDAAAAREVLDRSQKEGDAQQAAWSVLAVQLYRCEMAGASLQDIAVLHDALLRIQGGEDLPRVRRARDLVAGSGLVNKAH